MKQLLLFAFFLLLTACEDVQNDTGDICTEGCSTISGKFVTINNEPVANINVSLKYRISTGMGGSTRKIVNVNSDKNGVFYKDFFIKDSELGIGAEGYFQISIDDSIINENIYIKTNNLNGNTTRDLGFSVYDITRRDTVVGGTFYIPRKAYIYVNLNNFVPLQEDDYFEVQALYPFGREVGYNEFLDSRYGTGFSGYGNFRATGNASKLKVFVAEGEKNIIRITRRKNGINSYEDFPVFIPAANAIELTYQY